MSWRDTAIPRPPGTRPPPSLEEEYLGWDPEELAAYKARHFEQDTDCEHHCCCCCNGMAAGEHF